MAVEVVRGYDSNGRELIEKYEDADEFAVDGRGHLLVSSSSYIGFIAAFAPETWRFARRSKI